MEVGNHWRIQMHWLPEMVLTKLTIPHPNQISLVSYTLQQKFDLLEESQSNEAIQWSWSLTMWLDRSMMNFNKQIRMQHQFGEQLRNLFLKQIARWTNCKTTNDDGKSLGMMLAPHETRHNFSGSLCTKYPKSIQNVTGRGNKVGGTAWKETGWQKSLKEVGITVYWSN